MYFIFQKSKSCKLVFTMDSLVLKAAVRFFQWNLREILESLGEIIYNDDTEAKGHV